MQSSNNSGLDEIFSSIKMSDYSSISTWTFSGTEITEKWLKLIKFMGGKLNFRCTLHPTQSWLKSNDFTRILLRSGPKSQCWPHEHLNRTLAYQIVTFKKLYLLNFTYYLLFQTFKEWIIYKPQTWNVPDFDKGEG